MTVLSRCLQFNLRPMVPETIAAHLQQVLQAEHIAAEPSALYLLARGARGSMRDALSLTDQAIAFAGGHGVQEAAVRQMLGSVGSSHVLGLIAALAEGNAAQLMAGVQVLQEQGLSAASTLEDMARILQRMAVQQTVPGMPIDETDPDASEIARLASALPADETQLLYSICIHGRDELGLAPDEYAGLSMVLLRLLAFKPPAEKKTLKTAADAVAVSVAVSAPPASQAAQAAPTPQPLAAPAVTPPPAAPTPPAQADAPRIANPTENATKSARPLTSASAAAESSPPPLGRGTGRCYACHQHNSQRSQARPATCPTHASACQHCHRRSGVARAPSTRAATYLPNTAGSQDN